MTRKQSGLPGEDMNVREVHGQIWRELPEPSERHRSIPHWVRHFYMIMAFWGLWYLIYYSGGFRWDNYMEDPALDAAVGTEIREPAGEPNGAAKVKSEDPQELRLAAGRTVYQANCVACHQPNGLGVVGQFPPLAGSEWVAGSTEPLILMVLHGLMGPIEVKGVVYNNVMPAWGTMLNDEQVADVLTYVRSEWGDGASPVSADAVAELREKYVGHPLWTVETFPK